MTGSIDKDLVRVEPGELLQALARYGLATPRIAEILGRVLDVGSAGVAARVLFILDALTVAGVLAFALAGDFAFALGAFWFAGLVRALVQPLYLTWLNQGLEPGVRATVISMSSQANAFGQIAGGPAIGAVGTFGGIRAALTVAGLVLSPARLLYARAIRHGGTEPALDEVGDQADFDNSPYARAPRRTGSPE